MSLDAAISDLCARQQGVVTLQQLRQLGLGLDAVLRRARTGRLHRVHRGVYSLVPPSLLSVKGRWMAAVLACGPGAVLSHRSAADLHGLRRTARAAIDVTVPGGSHRRHPGIDVHRSARLRPRDVTVVDGIPCTTIARTHLDLAGVVRARQLERTLDQAAAMEVLDVRALEEQCDSNPSRAAAARLRRTMQAHHPGRTPTWSELEEAFLALTRSAGLPDPEVNRFIVLPDGEPAIRADFYWPQRRIVVETDGWKTHRTWGSFQRDRRDPLRLTAAGFIPIRTTWATIQREPEFLVSRLLEVFERDPPRPG
jgi:very-short-patch-repair endonuclease